MIIREDDMTPGLGVFMAVGAFLIVWSPVFVAVWLLLRPRRRQRHVPGWPLFASLEHRADADHLFAACVTARIWLRRRDRELRETVIATGIGRGLPELVRRAKRSDRPAPAMPSRGHSCLVLRFTPR